jgi:hypothetical protein
MVEHNNSSSVGYHIVYVASRISARVGTFGPGESMDIVAPNPHAAVGLLCWGRNDFFIFAAKRPNEENQPV